MLRRYVARPLSSIAISIAKTVTTSTVQFDFVAEDPVDVLQKQNPRCENELFEHGDDHLRDKANAKTHRTFSDMKKSFLSKPDKSSVGFIDPPISNLCAALNDCRGIYTTSSCSGRALLWLGNEPPPKRRDTPSLVKPCVIHDPEHIPRLLDVATESVWPRENGTSQEIDPAVWLRFEPFVLHVCCVDFDVATTFITVARAAGIKNVAVSGSGPKLERGRGHRAWRVAVEGSERLEMPLLVSGEPVFPLERPDLSMWLLEVLGRKFQRNSERTTRLLDKVSQGGNFVREDAGSRIV